MSSFKILVMSLLFSLIHGGLSESQNEAMKVLQEIQDIFRTEDENIQMERREGINCPPPIGSGILQVQSNSDIITMQDNQSSLSNLMFMCGTTQIMELVPVRWVLRNAGNGSVVNETIYEKRPRTIPLCCPGYIRNEDDICVPKCKGGCTNGLCVSPGNCACYQGYTLNSVGECVITCPCGCPHGMCKEDKCECYKGYSLDQNKKVCNPVCKKGCENGDCIAPNNCTCWRGYKKKENKNHVCVPECSNGCEYGRCTAPDICICDEGYYKSEKTGKCSPICTGCEHGNCLKPYVCECHTGYFRAREDCEPVCESQCINSTCSAPNHCTCFKGYKRSTALTCVPDCIPACKNADCVSPNQCVCHGGYVKDNRIPFEHVCIHISLANLISQLRQSKEPQNTQ